MRVAALVLAWGLAACGPGATGVEEDDLAGLWRGVTTDSSLVVEVGLDYALPESDLAGCVTIWEMDIFFRERDVGRSAVTGWRKGSAVVIDPGPGGYVAYIRGDLVGDEIVGAVVIRGDNPDRDVTLKRVGPRSGCSPTP